MSPMKPEDIEKLGRFIEGVGKTAGKVSDLAEKTASGIKEKVGPHIDRAVEALDKTFFGDKEKGEPGLHDQLSELAQRELS